jgi:hypothetical protein
VAGRRVFLAGHALLLPDGRLLSPRSSRGEVAIRPAKCPQMSAVACGRAREAEADCVSPVVASIYCSPRPAALQIAPAARLRGFCLYDSAPGEIITMGSVNR